MISILPRFGAFKWSLDSRDNLLFEFGSPSWSKISRNLVSTGLKDPFLR